MIYKTNFVYNDCKHKVELSYERVKFRFLFMNGNEHVTETIIINL